MFLMSTASAAIVLDPASPGCETNDAKLVCDWIEDTPERGTFILFHSDPVTQNRTHFPGSSDPFLGNGVFVSPSANWLVKIDFIEDREQDRLPGAPGLLRLDRVLINGEMQHIARADFEDQAPDGQPFDFFLELGAFPGFFPIVYVDQESGTTSHAPH